MHLASTKANNRLKLNISNAPCLATDEKEIARVKIYMLSVECSSKFCTSWQISKYNLTDRLMRYTALNPRNMQMALQKAYSLYTESLRTWRVCVLYGLGCDAVR